MFPALITVGVFLAVLLVLMPLAAAGEERREVRAALQSLEGYQVTASVREQEMLRSLQDRVLRPGVEGLARFTSRFTPAGYVNTVRHKLVLAGSPPGLDADRFLALKVLGAVSIVFWGWFCFSLMAFSGFSGVLATVLLTLICFFGPDAHVRRAIDDRQHEIAVRLPDILDLLVISVEAGLGFEQAIDRTTEAVPGALSDEFRRMLQQTRVGVSRAEALRALDERCGVPELRSFILAMLQADTFGVSISRLLRSQADEMRVRRRQRAQEAAQKAPVKMLIPLIFCIFPSLFVVILGPAGISIARGLR